MLGHRLSLAAPSSLVRSISVLIADRREVRVVFMGLCAPVVVRIDAAEVVDPTRDRSTSG
jgi:hypothetical protein